MEISCCFPLYCKTKQLTAEGKHPVHSKNFDGKLSTAVTFFIPCSFFMYKNEQTITVFSAEKQVGKKTVDFFQRNQRNPTNFYLPRIFKNLIQKNFDRFYGILNRIFRMNIHSIQRQKQLAYFSIEKTEGT